MFLHSQANDNRMNFIELNTINTNNGSLHVWDLTYRAVTLSQNEKSVYYCD